MSLTKNKMRAARDLIQQKQFAEARAILVTIDHPTATEWIAKIDQIAPAAKRQARRDDPFADNSSPFSGPPVRDDLQRAAQQAQQKQAQSSKNKELIITLAIVAIILAVGGVIIYVIVSRSEDNTPPVSVPGELPYEIRLERISGSESAFDFADSSCNGYLPSSPQHTINWPDDTAPLAVYVENDDFMDTVMAVRAPDGRWYCDDDSAGDLQPRVTISNPTAGEYAVYVGVYDWEEGNGSGTLHVSTDASSTVTDDFDFGFSDPLTRSGDFTSVAVNAGGSRGIEGVTGDFFCSGYVSSSPQHTFNWDHGGQDLTLYTDTGNASSFDLDPVMAVLAPDGSWHCDDDSAGDWNPQVDIRSAPAGQYQVFVGVYDEGTTGSATLYISDP